jgi:hypothetical protein
MTDLKQNKKKKKDRGEFKVIFKGSLLPGFNKEQVIENIAQLTKLPSDKIEKKFFSGKDVIIRRAHDQAHAQKLQQLFTGAGLEVVILRDASIAQERSDNVSPLNNKPHAGDFIKRNKFLISGSFLVIFLTVILIFAWQQFNISVKTPQSILQLEQSLANEKLIYLGHMNVARLMTLNQYLLDDTDALPGMSSTFYNKLKKSGVDPQKSVEHLLTAAYLEKDKFIQHSILLGKFPVQSVVNYLIKHHYGKIIHGAEQTRVRIAELNPQTCEKENYKHVEIAENRILIATEGHLEDLIRLLNKDAGQETDLSQWQDYRKDKLISFSVFNPEESSRALSGMAAMMARGAVKKNNVLDSVYAGVGTQYFPPGGLINLSLNSSDPVWLDKLEQTFRQEIAELKQQSAGLDNLGVFLNKLSVIQNSGQLAINLQLDSELKVAMENAITELAEQLFSFKVTQAGTEGEVAEQLDNSPTIYLEQYQAAELSDFNTDYDKNFRPQWQQGPFAIALDELLLEDGRIVMSLIARGQNIANMGNQQVKISINKAVDKQGKNFLEAKTCGQKAAENQSYFKDWGYAKTAYVNNNSIKYHELEAKEKIQLKKGFNFSKLFALEGEIRLDLPTRTEQVRQSKPEQNLVLSKHGTRIVFKPSGSNSLAYTLSGAENRVLAVRALNDDGEYLSQSSSSTSENLWGSGRSVNQTYHGQVAEVEVIYAAAVETLTYPFKITDFPPYYQEEYWTYEFEPVTTSTLEKWQAKTMYIEPVELTEPGSWQDKPQAQWHDGPFTMGLYDLRTSKHFGTTARLKIKTPELAELKNNLAAMEVFINYPQPAKNGDTGKSYYSVLKQKGYYMNGKFVVDKNSTDMEGQFSIDLPYYNEQQPLTDISGDIVVRLPLTKQKRTFTDMNIGAVWEDVGVKASLIRQSNTEMEFEISGSRDRLLQITLLDDENKRLSTAAISYNFMNKNGNVKVSYHGKPVKAQLTVAEGIKTSKYPFSLKLN